MSGLRVFILVRPTCQPEAADTDAAMAGASS